MPTVTTSFQETTHANPLDVVESIAEVNEWVFDRRSDQEIAVQAPGTWCDYSLFFAWNDDVAAMHFTCAFDMRVPPERRTPLYELLAAVNEKLWLGHFGLWDEEGLPLYRHAVPLRGSEGLSVGQMEDLVDNALFECERFYPAFQYVLWGGKTAKDAVSAAMVETMGEA